MTLLRIFLLMSFGLCFLSEAAFAGLDDFDLSDSTIDTKKLSSGGPAKDGIPAISNPVFIKASRVDFLDEDDLVVGISLNGKTKAYPLKILNWHEIVNDRMEGRPIAVTWCPLTKSVVVFDRHLKGKTLDFGVSGMVYNNNLVMYDRNSDGLWPQLNLGAVTGKFSGDKLEVLPSLVTTWKDWKERYPQTLLLSKRTGSIRNYNHDPYYDYHQSPMVMFPLTYVDKRLSAKSIVIGIRLNNISKAYPVDVIKDSDGPIEDIVGGVKLKVYAGLDNTGYITDEGDNLLSSITVYWFAWSSFNKDTLIFDKKKGGIK